jgi:hypothetical protein
MMNKSAGIFFKVGSGTDLSSMGRIRIRSNIVGPHNTACMLVSMCRQGAVAAEPPGPASDWP